MKKIYASLDEFSNKVKNNLEIAYSHMEKIVELSNNINVVGNSSDYDKLNEILEDFKKQKDKIKELEEWSNATIIKTKDMLDKILTDAYKLPSYYVTERIKLSK